MPALDFGNLWTIGVALVFVGGGFFSLKAVVAQVKESLRDIKDQAAIGQAETERLMRALHGRFDDLQREVVAVKVEQGRHDERIRATERALKLG